MGRKQRRSRTFIGEHSGVHQRCHLRHEPIDHIPATLGSHGYGLRPSGTARDLIKFLLERGYVDLVGQVLGVMCVEERADGVHPSRTVDRRVALYQPLHHTIVVADVVGSGRLNDRQQMHMRLALHAIFHRALASSNINDEAVAVQDLGDGIRLIVDASISPKLLLNPFIPRLAEILRRHPTAKERFRLRLRVAVHMGLLQRDDIGWAGTPLVHAARLVNAEPIRRMMAESVDADLVLIVSEAMYGAVLRQDCGIDPAAFSSVAIAEKETTTLGWVFLPG